MIITCFKGCWIVHILTNCNVPNMNKTEMQCSRKKLTDEMLYMFLFK